MSHSCCYLQKGWVFCGNTMLPASTTLTSDSATIISAYQMDYSTVFGIVISMLKLFCVLVGTSREAEGGWFTWSQTLSERPVYRGLLPSSGRYVSVSNLFRLLAVVESWGYTQSSTCSVYRILLVQAYCVKVKVYIYLQSRSSACWRSGRRTDRTSCRGGSATRAGNFYTGSATISCSCPIRFVLRQERLYGNVNCLTVLTACLFNLLYWFVKVVSALVYPHF